MSKGLEYSLQGLIKFVDAGILLMSIAGFVYVIARAWHWICLGQDILDNGR